MSHSCFSSLSYLPNIWCIFMTSQTAVTENGLVYTSCDCHNYCGAVYLWNFCSGMAQGTGWESCLTMFYVVMRDNNGHFYTEPVWRPGLLPTPVRGNPTPHHLRAQLKAGDKVATWCLFAMRYVNSRRQEIMCVFEPSSRPQGQGTTTHRTASDGWHGGSHSLIQWFEELPHYSLVSKQQKSW